MLLVVMSANALVAQYNFSIYKLPDIAEKVSTHEKIAVLPIQIQLPFDKSKQSEQGLKELKRIEEEYQYMYQEYVHEWIMFRMDVGKIQGLQLQHLEATNDKLKAAGLSDMLELVKLPKNEIAEILGVDAVISGFVKRSYDKSSGFSIAFQGIEFNALQPGPDAVIELHDGKSGEKLWDVMGKAGLNSDYNVDKGIWDFMKRGVRYLPYKKRKK